MKACTRCGIEKDESCFGKQPKAKDGLQSACKECTAAYNKARYEANKEEALARQKTYYEANKDKEEERTRRKAWREANKDKELVRRKARYKANKEQELARQKAHAQSFNGKYTSYKTGAKKRGLAFNLTKEQFLTFWQQPCFYCGSTIATIGIDRIDSSGAYELSNCRACCSRCNEMKMDRTEEEWYSQMLQILKHQGII